MTYQNDYFTMERSRWGVIGLSDPCLKETCIRLTTFMPCVVPAISFNDNKELRIVDKKACWVTFDKKFILRTIK